LEHALQQTGSRRRKRTQSIPNFDLAKEGVLQRIAAPTLVITGDRSKMHSVVIRSDAYHIAAAHADECVTHTLAFLKEPRN